MPRCIITGATGYIGSHVAKYLIDNNWEVSIVAQPQFGYSNIEAFKHKLKIFEYEGDITKLIQFFKEQDADVVMHLAAAVITNPTPEQIPVLIQSNVEFGSEILEAMRQSGTRLFIGTGSYWQNYNSDSYNPVDLYAATKEAFEKILQYYVDAFKFRAVTLRLFDVYGEDDKRPKLWSLLRDIAGTEQSIDISAGEQMLDMVHVTDVAKAYEKAYDLLKSDTDIKNQIFGVYSGSPRSLKSIINLFEKAIGKPIKLNWGARAYRTREVMTPFMGYKKLPNWKHEVDLEMGLTKFNNSGGYLTYSFSMPLWQKIA